MTPTGVDTATRLLVLLSDTRAGATLWSTDAVLSRRPAFMATPPDDLPEPAYRPASDWDRAGSRRNHQIFLARLRARPTLAGVLVLACLALGGTLLARLPAHVTPAHALAVMLFALAGYLAFQTWRGPTRPPTDAP